MTSSMFRRISLTAVCLITPAAASAQKLVTAPGPGTPPTVRVIDASGTDQSFYAYDPAFLGGVRVALGDVNGDGVPDIVTAAGPGGGPQVRVWSGANLSPIGAFYAYDPAFAGGVFVATGDVNGDGREDIITGRGAGGGPQVRIWDAATLTEIAGFTAYDPAFQGGVTVAAGDVDGDGVADIVTGAGPGGGPQVRVWNGTTRAQMGSFLAYDSGFGGGVNVAAGDIDGDGHADILTGAGPGGSPRVRAWSGANLTEIGSGFDAYAGGFAGGVTVGLVDFDEDGVSEIVTGPMTGSPLVRLWNSTTFTLADEYLAAASASGAYVGSNNGNLRFTSADTTTFSVGNPGTFIVKTKGGPKPTLTVSGTLPTGVTFVDNDDRTGTLAGTPVPGSGGVYPLVFTADNGSAPVTQDFTLFVEPICSTITITPAVMPDGLYQVVYAGVDFDQSGSSGSSFTWGATGLPAGLVINTSTGVVSGTPNNTVFNGAVIVTVTDNFGCSGTLNTTITVRPATDNDTYNGGVGNTQFSVGVTGIATPNVFVNDNVKNGDNGPGTVTVTFPAASANGAILEGTTDGTFVYTPNLGFTGPSDSFVYTLTDGNGVTNTATVTINLSGLVWYVNTSGGNGDGRSHTPFNALANAGAASSSGSVIYVHTGGPTTPGNLTLDANQTLHGQGATFMLNALVIPGGTPPTLTGTVTLANTTTVRGVNFSGAAPALTASALTGPVVVDVVNAIGGTTALSLTNVSGNVSVSNSSFTNTSGAEVLINQGTSTVDIGATISSNAGRSIDVQNRTGGTVTFTGAIADTAEGILLNANGGSTINFAGGLSLSTSTSPGFTATGGGIVSATQNNTTIVNTITTTTGTALNVSNTTIGASGLTFRSIASSGAANGIVLNSTGAGAFTVSGNGAAGTGGTITASTGPGISLTSTGAVNLSFMNVQNGSDDGIRGSGVIGFNLTSVSITGNGNAVGERGIDMLELTGSGGMSNATVSGSAEHNVRIANTAGTLTAFNVTGSTFSTPSFVTGDDGFLVEQNGTGTMNVSITGSTFTDNRGDHFQVRSDATAAGVINFTFSSNTLTTTAIHDDGLGTDDVIGGGITISPSGSTDVTFTINGNNIQQAFDDAINVNLDTASTVAAALVGTISNNTIGNALEVDSGSESSNTITITSNGAGTTTVAVTNNVVQQYGNGHGIMINAKEGSSTLNATLTGNTVSNPGTFAINGIRVDAGATSGPPADTGTTCAAITGNNVTGSGLATDDIRLRQRFNTTIRLPGYLGANDDTAAVNAFVAANNDPGLPTLPPTVSSVHNVGGGGGGFVGGAVCALPQ